MSLLGLVLPADCTPSPLLARNYRFPRFFHVVPPVWPILERPRQPRAAVSVSPSRGDQLILLFPKIRLSPLTLRVQRVVRRLARAGHEMPDNPTLGDLAGGHRRNTVFRALRILERVGYIKIEKEPTRRRILVLDINRWTAWGISRPGHAPYCARSRAECQEQSAKMVPLLPSIVRLGRPMRIDDDDNWEPADLCQYILADPPYRGGAPVTCDVPVMRGKSWCVGHHGILTRKRESFARDRQHQGV